MGNGRRQNALLVEIIIAVLFFALSATVILDVFATAYLQTTYADACNAAISDAQNVAARVYTGDDPETVLTAEGFVGEDNIWQREGEGYTLMVELTQTVTEAGHLRTAYVTAMRGEDAIVELPCSRYIPEGVAQ